MKHPLMTRLLNAVIAWLMRETPPEKLLLSDFDHIQKITKPGDVLLFSGRTRVAEVIKLVTQSAWSHAALYIGTLDQIENPVLRQRVSEFYPARSDERLVIESELGKGTTVTPLENYRHDHTRVCRPTNLSMDDAQQVIGYAIGKLGTDYDVRQILDLFRFAIPWGFLPRRWRSSLFETNIGSQTRVVCTSMLAEAFMAVNYPVLPLVQKNETTGFEFIKRNPRLYAPKDFDYSPFFEIVKYPFFESMRPGDYRTLPWNEKGWISQDEGIIQTDTGIINLNKPKDAKKHPNIGTQLK